jgi:hypothetical protein
MTPFRRILPVVGVALGAVLSHSLVGSATGPPDSTAPESTAPESSAPASSTPESSEPGDDGASGARTRWLEFVEEADAESYAGGAAAQDLADGTRVLMIGDSIMASTSTRYGGEMCSELVPHGWEVEMNAETGRFVDFGERVLDARLEAEWDAAVVMLGNNYGADKAVFSDYLSDIVERLAPRPTVLLTVTEFRPDRADVNDAIYEIAAAHDNVRVVDWAAETADDPALVGGDGLHLSNEGRVRYADLVGLALGSAPGYGEGDCLGSEFTDDATITPQPGQVTMPPSTWPNVQAPSPTAPPVTEAPPPVDTQPPPPPEAPPPSTAAPTTTAAPPPEEPPPEEPPPDEPPPDPPPSGPSG